MWVKHKEAFSTGAGNTLWICFVLFGNILNKKWIFTKSPTKHARMNVFQWVIDFSIFYLFSKSEGKKKKTLAGFQMAGMFKEKKVFLKVSALNFQRSTTFSSCQYRSFNASWAEHLVKTRKRKHSCGQGCLSFCFCGANSLNQKGRVRVKYCIFQQHKREEKKQYAHEALNYDPFWCKITTTFIFNSAWY